MGISTTTLKGTHPNHAILQHVKLLSKKHIPRINNLLDILHKKNIIYSQCKTLVNCQCDTLVKFSKGIINDIPGFFFMDYRGLILEDMVEIMDISNVRAIPSVFGIFNLDKSADCANLVRLARYQNFKFCFFEDLTEKNFHSGIQAVLDGDYWLPRKLLIECVKNHHNSSNQSAMLLNCLTKKETIILKFISDGYSNAEIAERLFVGSHTIKRHVYNIFKKLQVNNRVKAAQIMNAKK